MYKAKYLFLQLAVGIVGQKRLRLVRDLAGNFFGRIIATRNALCGTHAHGGKFPYKTSFDLPREVAYPDYIAREESSELVLEGQTKVDNNFFVEGKSEGSLYIEEFKSYKKRSATAIYRIHLCRLKSSLVSCPDGACISKEGFFLQNLARQVGRRPSKNFPHNHPVYFKSSRDITLSIPRAFLLAGPSQDVYYHWVWDILPKLKFFFEKGYSAGDKILIAGQRCSFKESFLAMFGIQEKDVIYLAEQGNWIHCDELFAVSNLGPTNFLTDYATFYQGIHQEVDLTDKIIFVDRKNANRRTMNCEGYSALFQKMGIEVCDFEILSVEAQVRLISESKVIIAIHGSALANMVFANKNSMVIELVPSGYQFPMFAAMAMTLGLKYGVIIGDGKSSSDNVLADFSICEDRLKSELLELLKID